MRGKLGVVFSNLDQAGNIPAYAGKTGRPAPTPPRRAEHPRVCGENHEGEEIFHVTEGTSPRMRGKLVDFDFTGALVRNIPAYAGKTPWTIVSSRMK